MAIYKKPGSKFWHYDFTYKGTRHQGSTDQTNINKARLVVSTLRSEAGMRRFGIAPDKPTPPFKDFMEGRFLDHCRRHALKEGTAEFYVEKTKQLLLFPSWADLRLSEIDEDLVGKYADHRRRTCTPATVNGELRTLRKALNLAYEWQVIARAPKVRMLPGERIRDFVVSPELEKAYFDAAPFPLKEAALLILDLGIRTEECVSLMKSAVTAEAVTIREGKTKNAVRAVPLTDRVKAAIELLCAIWPDSPWLFAGRKGKHFTRGALDNAHAKLRALKEWPAAFVLYSFRHTFGTRLAESGANNFEITGLMGHYDIRMSQRYVHPSSARLELAMKRKEAMDKATRGEEPTPVSTTPAGKPLIG